MKNTDTQFKKMVNFLRKFFKTKGKYFVSSLQVNLFKEVNVVVKRDCCNKTYIQASDLSNDMYIFKFTLPSKAGIL